MKVDYHKHLESAAKQMILIHRVDTLIRLILRTIIHTLKVKHAGILLYDKQRDEYVVRVSRGKSGLRIPSGFIKIKRENSVIRYFTEGYSRIVGDDVLTLSKLSRLFTTQRKVMVDKKLKDFFEDIRFHFSLYNAKIFVPGFFRNKLIGVLFLGGKNNRRQFIQEEIGFLSVLSSDAVMAIQNAWLFEDLDRQLERNKKLFLQTVMALATAIEAKDIYTRGHTERVSGYGLMIAEEVRIIRRMHREEWEQFLSNLKIASLLHDIGKIGVREYVLNKNANLNNDEMEEMKKHPLVGFSILQNVEEFQEPILGVKYHHERYDGGGYPEKLQGKQIPLIAQIIAIADTFDAMTTDRPYRRALDRGQAIEEIKKNRGKQFSPLVVDAFLKACQKGKI
jgi:HD-GYP domain-containing protein (c-di-GMP phosphodiesterase class II)